MSSPEHTLVLTRIIDAPPARVFQAWKPSAKPFVTLDLTFEDLGGKTKYTARALHRTAEHRDAHEKMGFHEGWGIATDQLAALVSGT